MSFAPRDARPADAVLFTLSVGLATGATGISIAHEPGHKRSRLDRLLPRTLVGSLALVPPLWFAVMNRRVPRPAHA